MQGTRQVSKRNKEENKCKGHREGQSIRKRFKVEKSMQGLQIRAEKSNVADQNVCARDTEEDRVCKRSKEEKSMQGRRSRTWDARDSKKNGACKYYREEQSMLTFQIETEHAGAAE
jgi:hypothetical protein